MPVAEVDPLGQVAERVVRRGLIGNDVDLDAAAQQLRQDRRGVTEEPDTQGDPVPLGGQHPRDGVVEVAVHSSR